MGMHIDPTPSGDPEFNENEMEDQDLERQRREVRDEREAAVAAGSKPSFWKRLFGRK
jgi:hypothetical protein